MSHVRYSILGPTWKWDGKLGRSKTEASWAPTAPALGPALWVRGIGWGHPAFQSRVTQHRPWGPSEQAMLRSGPEEGGLHLGCPSWLRIRPSGEHMERGWRSSLSPGKKFQSPGSGKLPKRTGPSWLRFEFPRNMLSKPSFGAMCWRTYRWCTEFRIISLQLAE